MQSYDIIYVGSSCYTQMALDDKEFVCHNRLKYGKIKKIKKSVTNYLNLLIMQRNIRQGSSRNNSIPRLDSKKKKIKKNT